MSAEFNVGQTKSMQDFEELALSLCARPGMYCIDPSLAAVCAYLRGFDAARDGGPLLGFQQWLIVRRRADHNLVWEGLVLWEAFPETRSLPTPRALDDDALGIKVFASLLAAFFKERRERSVAAIFDDHTRWLRRQKWYTGPLRR